MSNRSEDKERALDILSGDVVPHALIQRKYYLEVKDGLLLSERERAELREIIERLAEPEADE